MRCHADRPWPRWTCVHPHPGVPHRGRL